MSTGGSNKIVVTNDKGRLWKEESERKLAEAEKCKGEPYFNYPYLELAY